MLGFILRALLFLAGFAVWSLCSFYPPSPHGIREAWDQSIYWSAAIPLLLVAQCAAGGFLKERLTLQPLWVLAGHGLAMLLIHPMGTDLGLIPLSMMFIGLPGYAALLLASSIGRAILL